MSHLAELITELKSTLLAEQQHLRRELERIERIRLDGSGAYSEHRGYGTHLADDASGIELEELDLALEHGVRDRLSAVDEAIQRHEHGRYGTCERFSRV